MKLTVGGIDPSLRNLGLAKAVYDIDTATFEVIDIKLIETEKQTGKTIRSSSDDLRCAGVLCDGMHAWIRDCGTVFAEVPSGAQSARAAFSLGIATGVLGSIGNVHADEQHFQGGLTQVTPQQVKMLSVGSKNAAKEEVIEWAYERWPNLPWLTKKLKGQVSLVAKNEHMADACAAINAGVQTDEFRSLVQMLRQAQNLSQKQIV